MKPTAIICSLLLLVVSCEEKQTSDKTDALLLSKWNLTQYVDNSTGNTLEFPTGIDPVEIVFRKGGVVDLLNLCNYSCGVFSIYENDSISVTDVGPGTEKFCLPEISMNWETILVSGLIESFTYSINDNTLIINGINSRLVFTRID